MAADSTVTMGLGPGQKTFASANKIFTLSKYEPIGIMVFGNASFMAVPWETVIKSFRSKIGNRRYSVVMDCCKEFIRFLPKYSSSVDEEMELQCYIEHVYGYFIHMLENIDGEVNTELDKRRTEKEPSKREISLKEINRIAATVIRSHLNRWKKAKFGAGLSIEAQRKIERSYKAPTQEIINKVFGKFNLQKTVSRELAVIASSVATKFLADATYSAMSGVVIAGFGSDEIFPSYTAYEIEGAMGGKLKYREFGSEKIDHKYENAAGVAGFAQSQDVSNFMEGAHPQYDRLVDETITKVVEEFPDSLVDFIEKKNGRPMKQIRLRVHKIGRELRGKIQKEFKAFRSEQFTNPIIMTISGLPKDELARVAENLVNLATIRQRYSPGMETVGGPIDVAVISKGDGFVWIERKHYFEAAKNPQFFAKYYMK